MAYDEVEKVMELTQTRRDGVLYTDINAVTSGVKASVDYCRSRGARFRYCDVPRDPERHALRSTPFTLKPPRPGNECTRGSILPLPSIRTF